MNMIKKPKLWLILLALVHTFLGVIGSYIQLGADTEYLSVILFFLLITIYLLYAAFMTEGQEQARLATVLCAPTVVWFVICGFMGLEMMGAPVAELPSALLPITLWSLPAVTGIMNWNSN